MAKYQLLTDSQNTKRTQNGKLVYRIKYLELVQNKNGNAVPGEIGGYIENETSFSQVDNTIIAANATVTDFDGGKLTGDTFISEGAIVVGPGTLENFVVTGKSIVLTTPNTKISGVVKDKAIVTNGTLVAGATINLSGRSVMSGSLDPGRALVGEEISYPADDGITVLILE